MPSLPHRENETRRWPVPVKWFLVSGSAWCLCTWPGERLPVAYGEKANGDGRRQAWSKDRVVLRCLNSPSSGGMTSTNCPQFSSSPLLPPSSHPEDCEPSLLRERDLLFPPFLAVDSLWLSSSAASGKSARDDRHTDGDRRCRACRFHAAQSEFDRRRERGSWATATGDDGHRRLGEDGMEAYPQAKEPAGAAAEVLTIRQCCGPRSPP